MQVRLGWVVRHPRPELLLSGEASVFAVQRVGGVTGPAAAAEAQDHKHREPQQQEGAQGPEEDPEEGVIFHAQVLTAHAPGRVDGGGHTAGSPPPGQRGGAGLAAGEHAQSQTQPHLILFYSFSSAYESDSLKNFSLLFYC